MIPINVETRLHHFYFNYTIEDDLYEQLSNELMARVEDIWKNGQDDYFALTEQSIRIWSPPVDKSKNNKYKIEYAL